MIGCEGRYLLFGRDGLGEVPQLEGVVLGDGEQTRFHGVEGERPHAIKVAPQCVLGVPGLPEGRVLAGLQLRTEQRVTHRQSSLTALRAEPHLVAVVSVVVGDGEVGEVAQTQHALQDVVRAPQQEGLPPSGGKGQRLRWRQKDSRVRRARSGLEPVSGGRSSPHSVPSPELRASPAPSPSSAVTRKSNSFRASSVSASSSEARPSLAT